MRHLLLLFILLFSTAVFICSSAQDYYTGKNELCCNGMKYSIKHWFAINDISIENASNYLREQPRYKIGSNPVVYFNDASGMGNFADADEVAFARIVRQVFSDKEIALYTKCQGYIYVSYVVDSNNGKILEVRFFLDMSNDDKTLLSIPIEKFNKLETLLKERLVCTLSDELKKERQSYCISGNNLF